MATANVLSLWKPVEFNEKWLDCDTKILDEIRPAWKEKRDSFREQPGAYRKCMNELKREHALETGIVDRLYTLEKDVTKLLIEKGFNDSYVDREHTNLPIPQLFHYLQDHLEAMDRVYEWIDNNEVVDVESIRRLHAVITRNQKNVKDVKNAWVGGDFRKEEKRFTHPDGTSFEVCPPDQVKSEMEELLRIYDEKENTHPLILAAWFHHAFVIIHPFQKGNGRMARFLSGWILIQNGLFPLTIRGEAEHKEYFEALKEADGGKFQPLIDCFAKSQKQSIQKTLTWKEKTDHSLEQATQFFLNKLEDLRQREQKQKSEKLNLARKRVFDCCLKFFSDFKEDLEKLQKERKEEGEQVEENGSENKMVKMQLNSSAPEDEISNLYDMFAEQLAKEHKYRFNTKLPRGWLRFKIRISISRYHRILLIIHHYGSDHSALAIGFLVSNALSPFRPSEAKPHFLSLSEEAETESEEKEIRDYLEKVFAPVLSKIADEL